MMTEQITQQKIQTVLHTEASMGWGGQEKRMMRVMTGLDPAKYRVILACNVEAKIAGAALAAGIQVLPIRFRSTIDPVAIVTLLGIIRRESVDIVHTHSSRDGWNVGLAGRLSRRKPKIFRTRHLAGRVANAFVYRRLADTVITVGEYMRQQFITVYGLPEAQVKTVMTGIDLQRFDLDGVTRRNPEKSLRKDWGFEADDVVLICVAVMRAKKGHLAILEGLEKLHKAGNNRVKAVFVGDGPWRPEIEAGIQERKLAGAVHLAGHQEDIALHLYNSDLFVLASHEEALGTSLLEAMAMGLPVAGSDVGGIPSIVTADRGVLFPAKNGVALAKAIGPLVEDGDMRQKMGAAGQRFVRSKGSLAHMVQGTEALYR